MRSAPSIPPETQIREFLYMDPDTGELVAMVADDEGFRPAQAHEVALGVANSSFFQPALNAASDWAHASLDVFLRYEHAYPEDAQTEWDSDVCSSPVM